MINLFDFIFCNPQEDFSGKFESLLNSTAYNSSDPEQPPTVSCNPGNLSSNPGNLISNPDNLINNPENLSSNPDNLISNPENLSSNPGNLASSNYAELLVPFDIAHSGVINNSSGLKRDSKSAEETATIQEINLKDGVFSIK